MGILPGIADKHKFTGIGKLNATVVFMWVNSQLPGLTTGIAGKILWWFLQQVGTGLASAGVVLANVGIAKVETMIERDDFKSAMEDAIKAVDENLSTITPAEGKALDDKVKKAFDKFTDMSR